MPWHGHNAQCNLDISFLCVSRVNRETKKDDFPDLAGFGPDPGVSGPLIFFKKKSQNGEDGVL